MELRIIGKHAMVCAPTQGLGRACADGLAAEGVNVLITHNRGQTPGVLSEMTDELFEEALTLHYRAPKALLRAVLSRMKALRWARIVNITSAMVTAPADYATRQVPRVGKVE